MQIKLKDLTIRDLVEDYKNNAEEGVSGYGGRLDIRPPYQREFVYNAKQKEAVIDTVIKGFPLNVMYWAVRESGDFEIIDGQQRTLSICQFINGDFSYKNRYFHNLTRDEQEKVLDYKLTIYECSGLESEKLEWFKTINIAGEELTPQELRNAVYHGPWVTDAKRHFSKTNCPAHQMASDYMSGSPIRQDYLETVIGWVSEDQIEDYMGIHQHDKNADALWSYFSAVIDWVKLTFPKYRREMKGLAWGYLYNEYGENEVDPETIEKQVSGLMEDFDVTNKKGIYQYILSGQEKHLSIRTFTDRDKRSVFEIQGGVCPICEDVFDIENMEADHITPWGEGGKTIAENCQMLCKECNRRKSNR